MDREDDLLFYVQDRLSEPERRAFEARLETDLTLAAELAAMQATRAEFAAKKKGTSDLEAGWADLERRMDADRPVAANDNRPIRLGLMQVAAVAAVAVMLWQLIAVPQFSPGSEGYETVSQGGEGHILQVVFQPGATMAETTDFLEMFDATIVDGPSAAGVFRLGFAQAEQRDAALTAAQDSGDVFEFVAAE